MPEEQKPVEKTKEELAAERLARYQAEPDSFIECSQLVIAAIRNPNSQLGIGVAIGKAKRTELDIAFAEIGHLYHKILMRLDVEADLKRQAASGLVVPGNGKDKHGIMDFIRGGRN